MDYPLMTRLVAEFFGTMLLVLLGNGAVANVDLANTKGHHGGWILIGLGYGIGVMVPAMMFSTISGSQINPAFTIGLAVSGMFPWNEVLPYITAQMLGAMVGQLLVVAAYKPYYDKTTDTLAVLGTFATTDAAKSHFNGFVNEFIGTFVLVFGALGMTADKIDARVDSVALGFLVMTLVISLGGPTGPGLNPARDLGPRIVHSLFPLKHKEDSHWHYALVPVVAPILGGILATELWKLFFIK
ncbi:aquaporin family protein [Periweissella cryptocerci]|uniref:Aquaporin family protein n=1 Tax=Periweissella cryptocerci TaxID=2506420 RepID=A0A4P6YVJ5_9LACO|nr:MIP/aquaporin family protein [Periweissella cryptocerci]QBO36820.1 aquaporin family protein [Periweissella cryptocerci]